MEVSGKLEFYKNSDNSSDERNSGEFRRRIYHRTLLGFNKVSASKTSAYQVEHPRWNVCVADEYFIQCDFEKLYGADFSFLQNAKPLSVFLAAGSAVNVRKGFRI